MADNNIFNLAKYPVAEYDEYYPKLFDDNNPEFNEEHGPKDFEHDDADHHEGLLENGYNDDLKDATHAVELNIQPEMHESEYAKISTFTQTYVSTLVKPYGDALTRATSIEGILQWLPLVFEGEYLGDTQAALEQVKTVEDARNEIINILMASLYDEAYTKTGDYALITPWDIANARNEQLTKLFGAASNILPITVTVGPNVYTHQLSQDFVFGLLNILNEDKRFVICLNNIQVPLEVLINHYYPPKEGNSIAFKAELPRGKFFFSSPDVIQGIMTAAEWINVDPHTMVNDLFGVIDGTWTRLNF